jgi:hypothetical protein
MKTTLKLALALSLFCSIALADGNQGNTGYNGNCTEPDCPPTPCVQGCYDPNGDGGVANNTTSNEDPDAYTMDDALVDAIEVFITFTTR